MISHRIRRHPVAMSGHFEDSLVVTWALPRTVLEPLVPPGLTLDVYDDTWGFVAVAVVQVRGLRPRGLPPWCGGDFALTGYRLFVRHRDERGRIRRGLHILRSESDRRTMCLGGNVLTRYRYVRAEIVIRRRGGALDVRVDASDRDADLRVVAQLATGPASLPSASPFLSDRDARRFAGPLPWTFDHEPETGSIVMVRGRRSSWHPRAVPVDVARCGFLENEPFTRAEPRLASAFHVSDIDYSWDRGVRIGSGSAAR